jgi:glycosyltransferase involved in cell wall biosynthesis
MTATTIPQNNFHLGIDARMYGIEHAGIGRYVENLIRELIKQQAVGHLTLFLTSKNAESLSVPDWVEKVPVDIRHYTLREQTAFYRLLNRHTFDLFHFPHFNVPLFYSKPFIVTIHDILWHHIRGGHVTTLSPPWYRLKYFGYKAVVGHAVKASQAVIVPSIYVKNEILKAYTHLDQAKIFVTPEGVAESFNLPSRDFHISDFDYQKPYLVYTGSLYPHKNLQVVLELLSKRLNQRHPPIYLVIVSARDVFLDKIRDDVKKLGLADDVFFAGRLTDEEIHSVYRKAIALIIPSLSEGFGLTGLEAMAMRLPVIASRAGSLPEVYADAAVYFNPHSSDELDKNIQLLMTDNKYRQDLIEKGVNRARQFSWSQTAKLTLQIYQKSLSAGNL